MCLAMNTSKLLNEAKDVDRAAFVALGRNKVPAALPDEPLFIIEPSKSWMGLGLRDLWLYRELLYFLTWRDIKVRYKQTALGVAWAVIQPVFTMLVFTLFFGKFARVPSDNIPYPIFAYAAALPWIFFSNAVISSSNSIVGNGNLITKVYFPRMIIPGAAVAAGIIDFAIAFIVLIGLMFYYKIEWTWKLLMLPVVMLLMILLALGVGMVLSALNAKYRDIRYALPFLIQLWMFITPIIYPSSIVPEKWRWFIGLNPMTGIIEGFRSSLFALSFKWSELIISGIITIIMLVCSVYIFKRMEKLFADIV
jgi:lipopolysaccharide transport system permease protein